MSRDTVEALTEAKEEIERLQRQVEMMKIKTDTVDSMLLPFKVAAGQHLEKHDDFRMRSPMDILWKIDNAIQREKNRVED